MNVTLYGKRGVRERQTGDSDVTTEAGREKAGRRRDPNQGAGSLLGGEERTLPETLQAGRRRDPNRGAGSLLGGEERTLPETPR